MSLSRGHCETSAPWESTAAASQALLAGLGVFPARDAAQLREPLHTKGSPDRLKSIIITSYIILPLTLCTEYFSHYTSGRCGVPGCLCREGQMSSEATSTTNTVFKLPTEWPEGTLQSC